LVIYVPSALHPTLQADAIILVKKKMKKYLWSDEWVVCSISWLEKAVNWKIPKLFPLSWSANGHCQQNNLMCFDSACPLRQKFSPEIWS
jgi:hypothetical protein